MQLWHLHQQIKKSLSRYSLNIYHGRLFIVFANVRTRSAITVCVLRWFELFEVFLTIFDGHDRTLKIQDAT